MTDLEKSNLRLACLIQAIDLKQNPATSKDYENISVIELTKKLVAYIFG